MNNRLIFSLLIGAAIAAIAIPVMALTTGVITHQFQIGGPCLILDPEDGFIQDHGELEPGDEIRITQFVTNICDNTLEIFVSLNAPNHDWIEVDEHDLGIFQLRSGATHEAHAEIVIGNGAPVGPKLDAVFKVGRTEE